MFLRLWHEISIKDIGFHSTDFINALWSGMKWFPYNKGGAFRKWYGNQDYVINWHKDGYEIKKFGHLVPRSMTYMFFESISWSKISSGDVSFRCFPNGFMFDVAGLSMFMKETNKSNKYLLGSLNSSCSKYFLKALSPTLNYETGQISSLPIIINQDKREIIEDIVDENINKSKEDWDSFETSWDFKKHPLI